MEDGRWDDDDPSITISKITQDCIRFQVVNSNYKGHAVRYAVYHGQYEERRDEPCVGQPGPPVTSD